MEDDLQLYGPNHEGSWRWEGVWGGTLWCYNKIEKNYSLQTTLLGSGVLSVYFSLIIPSVLGMSHLIVLWLN